MNVRQLGCLSRFQAGNNADSCRFANYIRCDHPATDIEEARFLVCQFRTALLAEELQEACGVKPEIFRFPGGSVNVYNKAIYKQLIAEMTRRGYVYYDWNSSTGDASGGSIPVSDIVSYSLSTGQYDKKILLCHDGPGHQNTAEALPDIIEGLMEQGYSFAALDNSVAPICFGYCSVLSRRRAAAFS